MNLSIWKLKYALTHLVCVEKNQKAIFHILKGFINHWYYINNFSGTFNPMQINAF